MGRRGIGIVDAAALVAVLALIVAIAGPAGARLREMNRRQECAQNLKGVGISCRIYANENRDFWPMPPFKLVAFHAEGIDYLDDSRKGDPQDPGAVGFAREFESRTEAMYPVPSDGSAAVSTTRGFWILVRTGDLSAQNFICPSARDQADSDFLAESYYDFSDYRHVSYGYQVPFGARETRPQEGMDPRVVLVADKGPFYLGGSEPEFTTRTERKITPVDSAIRWRPYNSPNHLGVGQNVLYSDGHGAFVRVPTVGVNSDNIYTHMRSDWENYPFNVIHGESPHYASTAGPPYPGQDVFGVGPDYFSSTDSLIYP